MPSRSINLAMLMAIFLWLLEGPHRSAAAHPGLDLVGDHHRGVGVTDGTNVGQRPHGPTRGASIRCGWRGRRIGE